MSRIHKSGKGKRYKRDTTVYFTGRLVASVSILALLLVICLWVPLAVASDNTTASSPDDSVTLSQSQTGADGGVAEPATTADQGNNGNSDESDNSPGDDGSGDDGSGDNGQVGSGSDSSGPGGSSENGNDPGNNSSVVENNSAPDSNSSGDKGSNDPGDNSLGDKGSNDPGGNNASSVQYYDEDGKGSGDCDDCDDMYTDFDLICGTPWWDSADDYSNGLLSIEYKLTNTGTETAYDVHLTKHEATNGVEAMWFTNTSWEQVLASESVYFTIKWHIPENVTNYQTSLEVCARNQESCDNSSGNDDPEDSGGNGPKGNVTGGQENSGGGTGNDNGSCPEGFEIGDGAAGAEYIDCDPNYILELICSWPDAGDNGTFWESSADYLQGILSIRYKLTNIGTGPAYNLRATGADATRGVKLLTDLSTLNLKDLDPGEFLTFVLKWLLPPDVNKPGQVFVTSVEICADCQSLCEQDPSKCDPCELNPEACQPIDPCIEDPTSCQPPVEKPENNPPVVTTLTRAALPVTGLGIMTGAIISLSLVMLGVMIPSLKVGRKRRK